MLKSPGWLEKTSKTIGNRINHLIPLKAHKAKKLIPGLSTLVKIQPDEVCFQIEHQADSTATTLPELVADFNELLVKLQAAGIMKKK